MNRFLRIKILTIILSGGCVLVASLSIASEDPLGGLRTVTPEAFVLRNGHTLVAENGMDIFLSDELRTGSSGALGIIFKDNTRISLGPDSTMIIREYVFQPDSSQMGMLVEFLQGTAAYLSGMMGKIAPESISMQTPTATIGVRGTAFLVEAENR